VRRESVDDTTVKVKTSYNDAHVSCFNSQPVAGGHTIRRKLTSGLAPWRKYILLDTAPMVLFTQEYWVTSMSVKWRFHFSHPRGSPSRQSFGYKKRDYETQGLRLFFAPRIKAASIAPVHLLFAHVRFCSVWLQFCCTLEGGLPLNIRWLAFDLANADPRIYRSTNQ
jgi:hypothetical protein